MNGDDLFSLAAADLHRTIRPLAVRMRPDTLEEIFGQEQLTGPGAFLRVMIEKDMVPSLLFYGPSGVGKTTLAHVIAAETKCKFVNLNAVMSGTADLRRVIETAKQDIQIYQKRTLVFIDEIHRFNKSQQDILLPHVENGTIILIGATTENPYFEVNRPLLSRLRVIVLPPLSVQSVVAVLRRALRDEEKGLGQQRITAADETLQSLARLADCDARMALNLLEQVCALLPAGGRITSSYLAKVVGQRAYTYDKGGDAHYDTVSAFIKSMRGSDPDGALHYLARMIEAGESPAFIARRIVICAAEDVGLADPQALILANAAAQAVQSVGWPEGRIILSEAVVYIACAPKSNSAYQAIDAALADVRKGNCGEVPAHLKDAHYSGAAALGHGTAYLYPHNYSQGWVKQTYLPESLQGRVYYKETAYGEEGKKATLWHKRRQET